MCHWKGEPCILIMLILSGNICLLVFFFFPENGHRLVQKSVR